MDFNVLEVRDNHTAFAIALVRRTGRTNMFFRDNVIEILNESEDFRDEVEYLESNSCEYIKLLEKSGEYLQGSPISFEKELRNKELGKLLDETTSNYEYSFEREKTLHPSKFIRFDNQQTEEIGQVLSLKDIVEGYVEDIKYRIEQTDYNKVWEEDLRIFNEYLNSLT